MDGWMAEWSPDIFVSSYASIHLKYQFHPLQEERHVAHNNLKAACQGQSSKFLKQMHMTEMFSLCVAACRIFKFGNLPDQGPGVMFILTSTLARLLYWRIPKLLESN